MNELIDLIENSKESEFYPTPLNVVEKMIEKIDWNYIDTILEPSAGVGNILKVLARKEKELNRKFDVDCIEKSPNLRQILKYNFGDKKHEIEHRKESIKNKYGYAEKKYNIGWSYFDDKSRKYIPMPTDDAYEIEKLDDTLKEFFCKGINIIHDDFLTYDSFKRYSLIIMNPPFSNGEKHLLKALEIQKNGGNIICLLNAETIKNPYTENRHQLIKLLNEYNASIEFIENAFSDSERKTNVEIALIKVHIEEVKEKSDIFDRIKEAEKYDDEFENQITDIEISDYIKAATTRFRIEVKSGIELIRQYKTLIPYLSDGFEKNVYNSHLLNLTNKQGRTYSEVSVNEYVEDVRYKYWDALLGNPKFMGKLTSKLQKDYREKIENLKKYDFTEFNINTLLSDMNSHIKNGVENETISLFETLTADHSMYNGGNNRYLYNGWKTNNAYKIGKKVILPCYGIYSNWDGKPKVYEAVKKLEDIERVLNYLDGNMTANVDMEKILEESFEQGKTKKIPLKYFEVTFYKKGTVHIDFTCSELIDRYNIYIGIKNRWLPPSYGSKSYNDMNKEERSVIDDFQGEKSYNNVMIKPNYYLAPIITEQNLMIECER